MRKTRLKENIAGYIAISPWLVGLFAFTLGPWIASFILSFTSYDILTPPTFVGLANFRKMFSADPVAGDPLVLQSLKISTVYALASVPLNLVLGLSVALLMNRDILGISVFRTIYYLPSVLSGVPVALLWRWILNPDFGVINTILWRLFRIQGPGWLIDERWVIPSFILMSTWGVGGSMIIWLAGLQGIPTDLYEAAEIDGAGAWQRFLRVTIPMLSPVIFFNLVMGIISALQVFTQAYVMTEGGPNNASMFYLLYLYLNAFRWFHMGYACAMAWLLFAYILAMTLLVVRSSTLWVYYEGELN